MRIEASCLRRRGRATPTLGSAAMTRSAIAARNTDRTITNRVLMVLGAHLSDMAFTHASTCERRMAFIGRAANGTEPVARSALANVAPTHTCRADQSS